MIALLSIGGAVAGSHHGDSGAAAIAKAAQARTARPHGKVVHVALARFHRHTVRQAPADDQYGNPLEGKLCASPTALTFFFAGHSTNDDFLMITNCGTVPVTIGPPTKSKPDSPFRPLFTVFDNSNDCPIQGFFNVTTLQPGEDCVLLILFGPQSPGDPALPPGNYSDTWTFTGDTASLTVPLSGTLPTG